MGLLDLVGTNDKGHLTFGGHDCVALVEQFGTPLWVVDEQLLRSNARTYKVVIEEKYPGQAEVLYASKALPSLAIDKIVWQEGLSLDVASAGELYCALEAGVPASSCYMHGNFKSLAELQMALGKGVKRIIVDSIEELEIISALAGEADLTADILLRVTPGIKPKTHTYIQTGQIDTKFGFGIATGQAMKAIKRALELPNLKLWGVHQHIGSQIFGLESFEVASTLVMAFLKEVLHETGFWPEELNSGGGLGIRYLADDAPPSVEQYLDAVIKPIIKECDELARPYPKLMIEPGRGIVGEACITLYTVGPVKEVPGVRKYIAVDGGLSDNPRPALYEAVYTVLLANKAKQEATEQVTVSGKHCETDVLFRDVVLPKPEPGDILCVMTTGAYNYAMSSNYNKFPRPAMVLLSNGKAEVIVRRETLADLISHEVLPDRLKG